MEPTNENFLCPLTLLPFEEPVICDDGITYEKAAIDEWFSRPDSRCFDDPTKRISPVTKIPISTHYVRNLALRNTIESDNRKSLKASLSRAKEPVIVEIAHDPNNSLALKHIGTESTDGKTSSLYFSLNPPANGPATPNVYIAVVDVSGSMDMPALEESVEGDKTYSRLDLVKFSLETLLANCNDDDYFSLVIFSSSAKTVLPLTKTDRHGKDLAKRIVYDQNVQDQTNLWAGFQEAIDVASNPICENKNVSLIVLTDGNSNSNPPKGVFQTLKICLNDRKNNFSIFTLGYGYDLDCELLYDIAMKIGNGCFMFIPDCSMIGTNVTSLIAKTKSCFARNVQLQLEFQGTQWMAEKEKECNLDVTAYGEIRPNDSTWVVSLAHIDYGQPRDFRIVVPIDYHGGGRVKIRAQYDKHSGAAIIEKEFLVSSLVNNDIERIDVFNYRSNFIRAVFNLLDAKSKSNKAEVKKMTSECKDLFKDKCNNIFYKEFDDKISEHSGQVARAVAKDDWFTRWGKFHLLYLLSSHIRRFNSNFKDPSVQSYGGDNYAKLREACENVFCTLKQPKPSVHASKPYNGGGVSIANKCCNAAGGCFTGDCWVRLADGVSKRVCELKAGDEVLSWNGKTCRIVCVVKIKCLNNLATIVRLGNIKLSPYHPVYIDGKWNFPIDISAPESIACDYIYDFVVDSEHVINIDGFECVTWGHSFKGDVIEHPYFGSEKVVEDLKGFSGWKNGLVSFDLLSITRCGLNGLITGFDRN